MSNKLSQDALDKIKQTAENYEIVKVVTRKAKLSLADFEYGDLVIVDVRAYKSYCFLSHTPYNIYDEWVGYAAVADQQLNASFLSVDVLNTKLTVAVPIEMAKKVY